MRYIIIMVLISTLIFFSCDSNNKEKKSETLVLKGPYLGMKPPGDTPEIFAPGIVSTKDHFEDSPTFSPDGKEFFFTRTPGLSTEEGAFIYYCKEEKNGWTLPIVAPFSGVHVDFEAHFTPDGRSIIFNRFSFTNKNIKSGLWKVDRESSGWSKPTFLFDGTNGTVTKKGTIYFAHWDEKKTRALYRSLYVNGKYNKPEFLGGEINTPYYECHPFIDPDEHYLIFDSDRDCENPGSQEELDLYISFKTPKGTWSKVIRLGEKLNKSHNQKLLAYVTPDGKYLFYSHEGNTYWVDASIIKKLKPE